MKGSRRNVAILIFEQVEVLDFAGPYEVFSRTRIEPGVESRREGVGPFNTFTVALDMGLLRATGGLQVLPDYSTTDCPPPDILVVPGGFGTRTLLVHPPTLDWIRQVAPRLELLTSVCTGSLLLAKAGLLAGKRATTHWAALDLLQELDPSIQMQREQRVVEDGIITAAGVSSGIDMAFYVVEKLLGKEVADETAHYIEYPRWGRGENPKLETLNPN